MELPACFNGKYQLKSVEKKLTLLTRCYIIYSSGSLLKIYRHFYLLRVSKDSFTKIEIEDIVFTGDMDSLYRDGD